MTTLGTATVAGTGDTTTSTFAVGPAQLQADADVPSDVLSSCRWPAAATTVWVHGTMTIKYQGSIPQTIIIAPRLSLITDGTVPTRLGQVVIAAPGGGGYYGCDSSIAGGDSKVWKFSFSPGGGSTYDMWMGISLIDNADPTFTADEANAMQINFAAFAGDQFNTATTTWAGPHAATCDDRTGIGAQRLLLYATPPTTYTYDLYGRAKTTTCTPV